jgi:hypothetical protein
MSELADGWAFAKELSDALLKVRPLGGSELFVKRNGQYFADPKYCGAAIEDSHKSRHEVMSENVRLLRRVRALEDQLSAIPTPAQAAPNPTCGLRDRADRVLGEWWFWDDENLSARQRAEILNGICSVPSTDQSAPAIQAPHSSGERLPSSDAAVVGADTDRLHREIERLRAALKIIAGSSDRVQAMQASAALDNIGAKV